MRAVRLVRYTLASNLIVPATAVVGTVKVKVTGELAGPMNPL